MTLRSDAERLARTRVALSFLVIYFLCLGFMALGDRIYEGTPYLAYSRLATLPFFVLLLLRWLRLVRVRPPEILGQARRLAAMGKTAAARDRFARVLGESSRSEVARLERARRILQDGLAVSVAQEVELETGRCSLLLGELDRAVSELGKVQAQLPRRGEIALDLVEALSRSGQEDRAAEILVSALPHFDAVDVATLRDQPSLLRLVGDRPLPQRSSCARRILIEQILLALLALGAIVHALHLYARLF